MHPGELSAFVHRELARLPSPRAPRTLLPRILAAVGRDAPPAQWYTRPWASWPPAWRGVAIAVLVGLLAVYWQLLPVLVERTVGETLGTLSGAAARVEVLWAPLRAGPILRRIILGPYEVPLAMFLILMTAANMMVVAALTGLLGERRLQP